jgi:hypothetical protein
MKTFKELLEEKVISENMEEIKEMAHTELQIACDNATRIMEMMDEGIEPESWHYKKISMAADYLTSVYTNMRAEKSQISDEPEMNYFSMYGEEAELDEAAKGPKKEIPKSRYLTIAKMHDASGPTHGKVTRSPKGTMQYKGARDLKFDKKTNTNIVQIYSHPDHRLATIEKHTNKETGDIKYFIYPPKTESFELDEVARKIKEVAEGKGLWHNIRKRREKGLPRKKPGDEGYPETLDI